MCVLVLCISFILCAIRLNHAAVPQQKSPAFRISAATSQQQQVIQLVSGSNFTLFTFYNLDNAAAGPCNGTCQALNTRHTERINSEDCKVDLEKGKPEAKVIINTAISNSFIGIWSCILRTPTYTPGTMSIQNAGFRVFVTPPGWNPESLKTPSGSLVSVNVPQNTQTKNVTLDAGQTLESINITGDFNDYYREYKSCEMICEFESHAPVTSTSCTVNSINILAVLNTTTQHGLWNCTVKLKQTQQPTSGQQQQNGVQQSPIIHAALYISAKKTAALKLSKDHILIIVSAVCTIVVVVIVGQTICIIHFKKKANRAQIDKNLTPKNTINEGSSTDRYVKKSGQTEPAKGEVDECIYEALEPTRDEPPPLPPLATLPATPKPQHLSRSTSQSNLFNSAGASTTLRPPKSHQNPGRFNTVARSSSLERIKKRPPQPLPSESDIYEDVTPEDVSSEKPKLFGMQTSSPGPSTGPPTNTNRPAPALGKPLPGFTNILKSLKPPGSNVGRPPIAHKFPASAKHTGGMPTLPSATSSAKPMGGMPLLPSMISAANLKPVPVNKPKPPLPVTDRPRLPTLPSTIAKPYKPKPPVPLPEPVRVEPEPIPEDFESVISDDSDDEFKCYDVLPDYKIYENGAY